MVEITQEELDKLRAGANRRGGRGAPLGAPEGEGLAARSIADYLRGGGQRSRGPIGGGGLSYGTNTSPAVNYRQQAAQRGLARDAGASVAELQAADADNRDTTRYNKRQQAALDLAQKSSPYHQDLKKRGLSVADDGVSVYHTRPDGSRDFNYSSDGQYRGAIPDQFRNAPGNANTHDAHFNKKTGQWEAGDLSLGQTFRDIGQGFKDAYGNIRNTLPQIGGEVVSGFKDLAGNFGGGNAISGGGKDGVGNFGAVGDFFGGIGDQLGLTSYGDLAAAKAAQAPLAAAAPTINAAPPGVVDNRDRQNASQKATAAANRAQLSANKHTASKVSNFKKTGKVSGGFNMGGPIGYNAGGVARTNLKEEQIQQQQRMANAPQVASSGGGLKDQLSKKVIGSLLGGLGGIFNDGGRVPQEHRRPGGGGAMMPGAVHLNKGGPLNPNGYNEGGAAGETPIKKVMDEQKLAQQAKAFDLEQGRKQEAHDMAMKQKKAAFSEAQKMKKESATTKMKPKAPLGAK